jgi:2-keto-myo-inositol isomerase
VILKPTCACHGKRATKGLELWADKVYKFLETHSLEELNALFVDNGIAPLSLNALVFVGFRGDEYPEVQARCKMMCEIAQAIHCPMLVTVPSPTETRWQLAWTDVKAEYVTVLRDLAGIAAPYGVKLSFEFLGFGWCTVRTPRGAWEIVQEVDRPNVGMTVDCAHLFAGGGLLDELDALDPQKVFAFHLDDLEDTCKEAITDYTRLYPGIGVIPLDEICRRMSAIGYDDTCSIELVPAKLLGTRSAGSRQDLPRQRVEGAGAALPSRIGIGCCVVAC